MSFLRDIREAARLCPDVLKQKLLKDVAIELEEALAVLYAKEDAEALRRVVGLWTKAQKMLDAVVIPDPTAPPSGTPEPALLAEAA